MVFALCWSKVNGGTEVAAQLAPIDVKYVCVSLQPTKYPRADRETIVLTALGSNSHSGLELGDEGSALMF